MSDGEREVGKLVRKDFNLTWNAPFSVFFFSSYKRIYSHIDS